QHFGAGFNSRRLPGNWNSTANANEQLAFVAKDTIYTVDDFCTDGAGGRVDQMHREADRLLRGQGNRAGRQRLRPDATLRSSRHPRGIIVSTGEDLPRGSSLSARQFIREVTQGAVCTARLTECQRDGAAGLYAQAMAGFVRWLAPNYGAIRERLK